MAAPTLPEQPEAKPVPRTYAEVRMGLGIFWGRALDTILEAAPKEPEKELDDNAKLLIGLALDEARRQATCGTYALLKSFDLLMAETSPMTCSGYLDRVLTWLGAGAFDVTDQQEPCDTPETAQPAAIAPAPQVVKASDQQQASVYVENVQPLPVQPDPQVGMELVDTNWND